MPPLHPLTNCFPSSRRDSEMTVVSVRLVAPGQIQTTVFYRLFPPWLPDDWTNGDDCLLTCISHGRLTSGPVKGRVMERTWPSFIIACTWNPSVMPVSEKTRACCSNPFLFPDFLCFPCFGWTCTFSPLGLKQEVNNVIWRAMHPRLNKRSE